MAFDLMVGKTFYTEDSPVILGSIEFNLNKVVNTLYQRNGGTLLRHLTNPFDDFTLYPEVLQEDQDLLFRMMASNNSSSEERKFTYMLAAIVSYAIKANLPLHGVAD